MVSFVDAYSCHRAMALRNPCWAKQKKLSYPTFHILSSLLLAVIFLALVFSVFSRFCVVLKHCKYRMIVCALGNRMRQAYLGRIYSRISGLELSPTTVPNDKDSTPYLTYRFPLEFVSWYYFLITYNTGDIVFEQSSPFIFCNITFTGSVQFYIDITPVRFA